MESEASGISQASKAANAAGAYSGCFRYRFRHWLMTSVLRSLIRYGVPGYFSRVGDESPPPGPAPYSSASPP